MSSASLGLIELSATLGIVFAVVAWDLLSMRRDERREQKPAAPDQDTEPPA